MKQTTFYSYRTAPFQFVDQHQFYLPLDMDFLVDTMKNNMDDLAHNWRMMGRPTFICPVNRSTLGAKHNNMKKESIFIVFCLFVHV